MSRSCSARYLHSTAGSFFDATGSRDPTSDVQTVCTGLVGISAHDRLSRVARENLGHSTSTMQLRKWQASTQYSKAYTMPLFARIAPRPSAKLGPAAKPWLVWSRPSS